MNPENLFYNSVKECTEMWKAAAEKWFQIRSIEIFEETIKLRIDAAVDSILKDDNFHKDTLIEIQNYMIEKQAQDERWQALTEDGRQARIASYKKLLNLPRDEADSYLITIEDLEKLYGKHNLQPQPLTYEDVARELFDSGIDEKQQYALIPYLGDNDKWREKLEAIGKLLVVAKFLNGDWKPDWDKEDKFYLFYQYPNECVQIESTIVNNFALVYFKSFELAEQAIQILGEDTVRLALTTVW